MSEIEKKTSPVLDLIVPGPESAEIGVWTVSVNCHCEDAYSFDGITAPLTQVLVEAKIKPMRMEFGRYYFYLAYQLRASDSCEAVIAAKDLCVYIRAIVCKFGKYFVDHHNDGWDGKTFPHLECVWSSSVVAKIEKEKDEEPEYLKRARAGIEELKKDKSFATIGLYGTFSDMVNNIQGVIRFVGENLKIEEGSLVDKRVYGMGRWDENILRKIDVSRQDDGLLLRFQYDYYQDHDESRNLAKDELDRIVVNDFLSIAQSFKGSLLCNQT
jgi:hypothetical protein